MSGSLKSCWKPKAFPEDQRMTASIQFTIEQKGTPDRLIMLHVLTVKTN